MRELILLIFLPFFTIAQTGYVTYNNSTYDFTNGYINPSHVGVVSFDQNTSLEISFKHGLDDDNGTMVLERDSQFAVSESMYDEKGRQIFRDFDTQDIIIRNKKSSQFEPFIIKDHWLVIKWNIFEEFKEILNYKVQKAEGIFRGRTYTVWFTEQLPYPYGPWKLFGLPGVILEYSDGDKNYGTATEICYPCDLNESISIPVENNIRTIEEHVKISDNIHIYHILEFRKRGIDDIIAGSKFNEKELLERREKSREYLFEWENENTKRAVYDKKILKQAYEFGPSTKRKLQKLKEEKEKSDNDFNIRTFRN